MPTTKWSAMLEALLSEAGQQAEIALRLCRHSGRTSTKDFETAKRNLSNWISGRSLPQRKSFRALTQALGLAEDPTFLLRWNAEYQLAQSQRADTPDRSAVRLAASQGPEKPPLVSISFWKMATFALASAWACTIGLYVWYEFSERDDGRTIGYLPFAQLKVGDSALLSAKRGDCGQLPPEWMQFEHEIPVLVTGHLVDDGLGTSLSVSCGGKTPGRLVRFVAEKPGDETFDLFQRSIRVVVTP